MPEINLKQKFPSMQPVSSPPALFRINGCGVGLYGRRDADAETGTYVATWCLSLVYIPLLALRAYRVARAENGGWYFLGREPLSAFARGWNVLLVALVGAGIGFYQYNEHTGTPAYRAKQQMASAKGMVDKGQLTRAAAIYQGLANGAADQAGEAAGELIGLLDHQCQEAKLSECAGVYACAAEVARRRQQPTPAEVVAKARTLVALRGEAEPAGGVAVLDAVRPLVLDTRELDARRLKLLQKWAAAEPSNLDAVAPLASLLEESGEHDAAKKLLMPVKDKLGDGEGARVLGMILGRDGDYDAAYALLWPYVKHRLDALHSAEKGFEDTIERIEHREIKVLEENKGPSDFYRLYEAAATKESKNSIVQEHLNKRLKSDPDYAIAQDLLRNSAHVVPVALELGIVSLQRAQGQADPAARKSQLEAAEQTFLAVRGVAGESDEYRIWLAQVYYWLGKQADGRKLFDEYLVSKNRAHGDLLQIGSTLRQLGADGEARALAEEAYKKATKPEERYSAAGLRHVLFKDNDDKIEWLTRGNQNDAGVKASLAKSLGDRAHTQGHDDEAANQYRAALAVYESMPRSASSLNETALACYAVFRITGDQQMLDRCNTSFQQAVELEPSNTVLLLNAGVTLLEAALTDVIGDAIDLRALRMTPGIDTLGHLYKDQATRDAVVARVKGHPGVARALSFVEKVTVLAPKGVNAFAALYSVHQFTHDEAALGKLHERVRAAELDTADELESVQKFLKGDNDERSVTEIKAGLKRNEERIAKLRPKGGPTVAVALAGQADLLMSLCSYTEDVDLDKAVALAEEAVKASASADTITTLSQARLYRAARDLSKADPAFAAYCGQYRRSIGIPRLVAAAASEPTPFQKAVLQHSDVRQALAIAHADSQSYTEGDSPMEWAMTKTANPAEAQRMAERIRKVPRKQVEQSIAAILSPSSAADALDAYWLHQARGEPDAARDAIRKIVAAGIPMPIKP